MTGARLLRVTRADERFVTPRDDGRSFHAFSFGAHYDPDNVALGPLTALNEEQVDPGGGFDDHDHHDVELVTWVVDGALAHSDTTGDVATVVPGVVQVTDVGPGLVHAERAAPSADGSPAGVRFVQSWLRPGARADRPSVRRLDVAERLAAGGLVAVASGRGHDGALRLGQPGAALHVGRPAGGAQVPLPAAPWLLVHVVRGDMTLTGAGDGPVGLGPGDAARLADVPPGAVHVELPAGSPAGELLVWELHAAS